MLRRAMLALLAAAAAAAPAKHHDKATPLQLAATDDVPKMPFVNFNGAEEVFSEPKMSEELGGCEAEECQDQNQCYEWNGLHDINDVSEMQCGVFWFLHIEKNAGTVITWRMQEFANNRPASGDDSYDTKWQFYDMMAPVDWDMDPGKKSNWYWQYTDEWKKFESEIEKDQPHAMLHWHWGAAPMTEMIDSGYLHDLACKMKAKGCEVRLSAILREPMSRTVSKLGFDQVNHSHMYDFVSWDSNPQTKYIVYNDETHWPESLWTFDQNNPGKDDWVLGKAWETLKYFDVIGQSEDIVAYLNYVEKSLGFKMTPKVERGGVLSNPSELPYKLSNEDYGFLRPRVGIDTKLYKSFCKSGNRPTQTRCE